MIKYVLIDLDGTITDSEEGVTKCIAYALESFGIRVESLKTLRKYIGPPITWSFADAGLTPEQIEPGIQKYRERYDREGLFEARIYDGIPEMLKKLHDAGKTLILATSKPIGFAKKVMEYFKMDVLMDDLCGAGSDTERNTKAAVLEYILEKHHITDKSEALMLGDTKFDVEGANIVGLKTMGVLWGFGSRESLENEGAAYIVSTPEEAAEKIINL
ncbi:MAG: HAD hydrolase-like protein [Lachnospiraceae bacterium]|nr:HAD hydrolase-like protein [Lachnospiraceae bacterium]